jgi:hypothetical protein
VARAPTLYHLAMTEPMMSEGGAVVPPGAVNRRACKVTFIEVDKVDNRQSK